jgi:hypothetical protein
MGESKRKQRLREKLLAANPHCIYCGGAEPATTIDHVPPRAVFDGCLRPQGLEFSACEPCNNGAGRDELLAALISRMYPNIETDAERREMRQLLGAVSNNFPGLLPEMLPSLRQARNALRVADRLPPSSHVMNLGSPRLQRALYRFAAKVGYALHYELTKKIVPADGAARAWIYTNYQALTKGIPDELKQIIGPETTLRQGSWTVSDQFQYSSLATDTGTMSAHFAGFRFSFAIVAFVAEHADNVELLEGKDNTTLFRPGCLRNGQA